MNAIAHEKTSWLMRLAKKTNGFFYGFFYPVILCLVVFLCWIINLELVGYGIIVLTGALLFILYKDLTPILPLLLTIPAVFRSASVFDSVLGYLFFIPPFIALVFNLVKYPMKRPTFNGMCKSLVFVTVSLTLGGLFTNYIEYFANGVGQILISGAGMLVVCFMLSNRISPPENFNLKKYLCISFLCVVNLACLQLIYAVADKTFNPEPVFVFPNFCWANTNHIAYLIIMALPFCYYLLTVSDSFYPIFLELVLFYICIVIADSDACIALAIVFSPILIWYAYKNLPTKHIKKFKLYVFLTSFCLCAAGIAGLITGVLQPVIIKFVNSFAGDSVRLEAYTQAIDSFLKHPLFGMGLGEATAMLDAQQAGYFHSTFFHVIACTGSVGILAYVVYYVQRIKLLTSNGTVFGLFALISFMLFAVYSIVDNGEFNIIILFLTVIVTVTGVINEKGNGDNPLPLSVQHQNGVIRKLI